MPDRRTFVGLVAGALLFDPLVVCAQQARKLRTIGWLSGGPQVNPSYQAYFTEVLRNLGWIEGTDFVYASRFANNRPEQLSVMVGELVRMNCDVIFSIGTQASLALKRVTTDIPVVLWGSGDPVANGFVASLARPGGNMTGLNFFSPELAAKRLQLMKDLLPRLALVAVLVDPTDANSADMLSATKAAAQALEIRIESVEVRSLADFDDAFDAVTRTRPGGMLTTESPLLVRRASEIAGFASAKQLPAIYPVREFADAGGLISYGPNLRALLRVEAGYVDKILRDAKPADMAIAQPTEFEMVINLKTAKVLGITIPQSVLLRADEVIQ